MTERFELVQWWAPGGQRSLVHRRNPEARTRTLCERVIPPIYQIYPTAADRHCIRCLRKAARA